MKRVIKSISLCLMLLISVLLALTLGSVIQQRVQGVQVPMLFGYGGAIIETGSMEPAIPVGSFVVIRKETSYQPGDIVAYTSPAGSKAVTHRIISIQDGIITTQGDANNTADPEFEQNLILGKVVAALPKTGNAILKLRQPHMMIATLGVIAGVVAIAAFPKRKKAGTVKTSGPNGL